MAKTHSVTRVPSFEADLERFPEIEVEQLEKFLVDLAKAPDYLKNAHALKASLVPLWSAHLNAKAGNFVVLYFLCDGNPERCFRLRALGNRTYLACAEDLQHSCDGAAKMFVCRIGRHEIYRLV